jgi:exosortase/archaeosortase family protein
VNILRVYLIILAGVLISPEITVQLFHSYAGMLLFIAYFGVFWGIFYKKIKVG